MAPVPTRYNAPMRRIGRWMISGLTVLSLVLCVGAGFIWLAQPPFCEWNLVANDFQIWAIKTMPLSDPRVAGLPDYDYGALGFATHADHGPPVAFRRRWKIPDVYTRVVEIPLWPL